MGSFDWYVSATAAAETGNKRVCTFKLFVSANSAAKRNGFRAWLSDSARGGLTGTAPSTVSTSPTTALMRLREVVSKKAWILLLPASGTGTMTIGYAGVHTWHLCIAACDGAIHSQSVAFA